MRSRMALAAALAAALALCRAQAATVQLQRDAEKHQLTIAIDDKKILEYHYAPDHFLPYIHPLLSPSGRSMLVRLTKPYPHHRSFWIADKVQLEGHPSVNFYAAHYGNKHRIRHDKFLQTQVADGRARLKMQLVWELDKKIPVLKETRDMQIVPLEKGEYLIDLRFTVSADYADVHVVSDATHYAWPYLRMEPKFSVKGGNGTLVNSEGGLNQKGTHNKAATWCDYSATIGGDTEGVAIFSHSENGHPHRWLTRDYGCFGPRRVDKKSGKRFTLKKGESMTMRVGILVHRGNARTGKVAERYKQYIEGKLSKLE